MNLSIIVSTYNRARDLGRLLDSLARATRGGRHRCELIVIDNNSRDDTAEVIAAFQANASIPVRHLFEARQGKSFALNAGLAVATGEVVVFTDDDVILPPEWLERIADFFETHDAATCVGGAVRLYAPMDDPVSTRTASDATRTTVTNFTPAYPPVMGCNMAMRADVLRAVGPFDTDLGPGSRIGVAEDLDLLYRIVRLGYTIAYEPDLWVWHNHGRRQGRGLATTRRSYLTGRGAFYCKHALQRDHTVVRWAYWECRYLLGWNWLTALFSATARRRCADVGLLVLGAAQYVRYRSRGAVSPVPPAALPGPDRTTAFSA